MKNKELIKKYNGLSVQELNKEKQTEQKRLRDLIIESVQGKLTNARSLKAARYNIALIGTIINQKKYESQ